MKRTINEAQLRAVVSKNLNKFLNEGIPWEWDGKYVYQGTGSDASDERVKKIQDKSRKGFLDIPSLRDKNNNNHKKWEDGRCLQDYKSDTGDYYPDERTTYWMLKKLGDDISEMIDDFKDGYRDVHFEPETEKLLEDIWYKANHLSDTSKRDWAGREDY